MSSSSIVNNLILDSTEITGKTKQIYINLSRYAFDNISCFPSVESMAKVCGKCTRTVQRATQELRELGLLKIFVTGRSNHYILIPPEWVADRLKDGGIYHNMANNQYITSQDEFDCIKNKILKFQIGDCVVVEGKKRNPVENTTVKTMLKKYDAGDFNMNLNEFMAYAEYRYENETGKKMGNNYKQGTDVKEIKKLVEDFGNQYTFEFITNFVLTYDELYGQGKWQTPRLSMMGWSRIYNTIKTKTDRDMTIKGVIINGEVF